uniref:Uncharacterized protein n=1 Tax=Cannabis sativa TaxID=3483 RepID=A0A803QDI5_CANSA
MAVPQMTFGGHLSWHRYLAKSFLGAILRKVQENSHYTRTHEKYATAKFQTLNIGLEEIVPRFSGTLLDAKKIVVIRSTSVDRDDIVTATSRGGSRAPGLRPPPKIPTKTGNGTSGSLTPDELHVDLGEDPMDHGGDLADLAKESEFNPEIEQLKEIAANLR